MILISEKYNFTTVMNLNFQLSPSIQAKHVLLRACLNKVDSLVVGQ